MEIIRKDNSRKPSFEMLKRLTHEEWWTNTEVVTDANGMATVEAFKGDYEISAEAGKAEVKLDADGVEVLEIKLV